MISNTPTMCTILHNRYLRATQAPLPHVTRRQTGTTFSVPNTGAWPFMSLRSDEDFDVAAGIRRYHGNLVGVTAKQQVDGGVAQGQIADVNALEERGERGSMDMDLPLGDVERETQAS